MDFNVDYNPQLTLCSNHVTIQTTNAAYLACQICLAVVLVHPPDLWGGRNFSPLHALRIEPIIMSHQSLHKYYICLEMNSEQVGVIY